MLHRENVRNVTLRNYETGFTEKQAIQLQSNHGTGLHRPSVKHVTQCKCEKCDKENLLVTYRGRYCCTYNKTVSQVTES